MSDAPADEPLWRILEFHVDPALPPEEALEGIVLRAAEELDCDCEAEDFVCLDADADLEKAVPAHHSQFQQRTRHGRFVRFHHGRVQPRDARGRFRQRLSRTECAAAVDNAQALVRGQLSPRLQTHLGDFLGNKITGKEWHSRVARELSFFYEAVYKEGRRSVGDPAIGLAAHDRALLNRLVEDELEYLAGFQRHVETGGGRMAYDERMELYARAAREAFWCGFVMGDLRKGRVLAWEYGATEDHCGEAAGGKRTGCSDFVALGWLAAHRFVAQVLARGFAPQSGSLECQGHRCRCRIREKLQGVLQPVLAMDTG